MVWTFKSSKKSFYFCPKNRTNFQLTQQRTQIYREKYANSFVTCFFLQTWWVSMDPCPPLSLLLWIHYCQFAGNYYLSVSPKLWAIEFRNKVTAFLDSLLCDQSSDECDIKFLLRKNTRKLDLKTQHNHHLIFTLILFVNGNFTSLSRKMRNFNYINQ